MVKDALQTYILIKMKLISFYLFQVPKNHSILLCAEIDTREKQELRP